MASGATVDNYTAILAEDSGNEEVGSISEETRTCTAGFEDVAEVQDALLDDSSASDNEVVRTSQLRLRPRQKRAHRKFGDVSVVLRRKYQQKGNVLVEKAKRLEIQSTKLQTDLRQLLEEEADGINWDDDPIKIPAPYYCLFYKRKQIEAFSTEDRPVGSKEEMRLVVDFIYRDEGLKTTLKRYDQCVPNGKITFDILWTLYSPNSIVVCNVDDSVECYRCISVSNMVTMATGEQFYDLVVEGLDFDGVHVGTRRKHVKLKAFQGARDIQSLTGAPLEGHPRQQEMTELVMRRYGRFQSLIEAGHSNKHVHGSAWIPVPRESWKTGPPELKKGFQVNGHVVMDYKAYLDHYPDQCCRLTTRYDGSNMNEKSFPPIPEDTKMLFPARMPGFSLRERRWGWFLVDAPWLNEIEWKEDPFRHLVMEEKKKNLVLTLVKGHEKGGGVDFEDLVAGKGKGLIILLRGQPGLGKTLLAECLSETVQRPLYRVTAGELTIDVSKLEETLENIFKLGKRWKALVLLDEAEVLVSARTKGNVELNAVVAAFLRVLEYYEGILFLTTNKPDDFDEAIRDRIQLEVTFDSMSSAARRTIWENMLDRIPGKNLREDLWTPELLDALSELEVNGREIKNLLRLATCHASGEDMPLNPGHLVNVIQIKSRRHVEALERIAGVNGSLY